MFTSIDSQKYVWLNDHLIPDHPKYPYGFTISIVVQFIQISAFTVSMTTLHNTFC